MFAEAPISASQKWRKTVRKLLRNHLRKLRKPTQKPAENRAEGCGSSAEGDTIPLRGMRPRLGPGLTPWGSPAAIRMES